MPQLEVAVRLLEPAERKAVGERSFCEVAGELRPARGCLPTVGLVRVGKKTHSNRFSVAPNGRGKPLLVEVLQSPDRDTPWEVVARRVLARAPKSLEVPEASGAKRVHVRGFALSTQAEQTRRSQPFTVPPGASLRGGIALDPSLPAESSGPVEFRVDAHTADGETSLLRKVLSPEDASEGWVEYSIPLERFAGTRIELAFTSRMDRTSPRGRWAAPLWSLPAVLEPASPPSWNFVLVSLDTLRADHLGIYGAPGGASPVLDAFSGEGVVFERASTTFPSTTASHMSMMTGLYPGVHETRAPPRVLDRGIPTLAQLLAAAGYATGAVTENGMIVSSLGFRRGFDSYVEFKDADSTEASGHVDEVMRAGISWLEQHSQERFFLFLHTYQIHNPYNPPAEFDRFRSSAESDDEQESHRAAYRGEILYTDDQLKRLFGALDSLGLAEDTIVIVTADHGEGFGEHGVVGHGHSLTEEVLHVPLLIRAPGLASPGRRIAETVSVVDLAPTILDLGGVEVPTTMQGRSLRANLAGESAPPRGPVFSELGPGGGFAIREGDIKWIVDRHGVLHTFDLRRGEGKDQEVASAELARRGESLRLRFQESSEAARRSLDSPKSSETEIDPKIQQQLRALGYVD